MTERADRERRVRIRELTTGEDPAFGAAYALLRRTFPKAELLPKREWVTVLRERVAGLWTDINWHLFVAEREGSVVGMASGSYLGNVNVGIVGYIAVRRIARTRGLGPRLRHRLVEAFERDALRVRGKPLRAVVGEVAEENPWLRHLVRRLGALALDFSYCQPSLGRGGKEVALVLYYQGRADRRRVLPASEVQRLLYTMWRRMCRVANPLSNPAFRRMRQALAGRRAIGSRVVASSGGARQHR